MFKTLLLLTTILVGFSIGAAQAVQRSTKEHAWDLGHNLSLAALGNAEGGASSAVESLLAKAKGNGKTFGVTIPDLPPRSTDKASNRAEALAYLLQKVGGPMGGILKKDFDEEHALLFEISLKSNLLLMLYLPGEKEPQTIANVIRTRSARIGLPEYLTTELLGLVTANADFAKVKNSVFKMHADVSKYLAKTK